MAKVIIKNGPKDVNQMTKLIVDIATRQVGVPANGIVETPATTVKAKRKAKK